MNPREMEPCEGSNVAEPQIIGRVQVSVEVERGSFDRTIHTRMWNFASEEGHRKALESAARFIHSGK